MRSGTGSLSAFEAGIGYSFKIPALLEAALTHPSLRGSGRGKNTGPAEYERLEFLGDRVLGLVMAERLYRLLPSASEGEMSKRLAALVSREALKKIAADLGLDRHVKLAGNEDTLAERRNIAVLSDAMEALIGAMYLDGGLEPVRKFIHSRWPSLDDAEFSPGEPKTELQEWAQGRGLPIPRYKIVERSGPAHAPEFTVEVGVEGFPPVTAKGNSIRSAEKAAAGEMLKTVTGK